MGLGPLCVERAGELESLQRERVEGGLGVVEGKLEWAWAKDSESFRRGKRNLLATRF